MSAETIALLTVALLIALGAVGVLLARELMRLLIALGLFLLGVAGLYLYEGLALLATSQVFLYVGGVLVLLVFGVMVVHRSGGGRVSVTSRHDIGSAAIAVGVAMMLGFGLSDLGLPLLPDAGSAAAGATASSGALLGARLPAFELAGALLLVALVAVVVIVGGRSDR